MSPDELLESVYWTLHCIWWNIWLKCDTCIWLVSGYLQITFEFRYAWCTFDWIIPLMNCNFWPFLLLGWRYFNEIIYMVMAFGVTDQIWVSSHLTHFSLNYVPWWIERVGFPDFLPYWLKYFSWNLIHGFISDSDRSSFSFSCYI
jgi:hypothetical protein